MFNYSLNHLQEYSKLYNYFAIKLLWYQIDFANIVHLNMMVSY